MPKTIIIADAKVEIPRGIDGFWKIIRQLDTDGPWTIADVDKQSNVRRGAVITVVKRLAAGGFVEPVGERPHPRDWFKPSVLFRVVKKVEELPELDAGGHPKPEPQIETIWRTMKMLKHFTPFDIARVIHPDDPSAKVNTVRSYLMELNRVGILARTDNGKKGRHGGGTTEASYRILRNVGAKAPKILSGKIVYDPNAQATLGTSPTREVLH